MVARAFIAQRAVDQDEIRRRPLRNNLPRRGDADEEATSGDKQLFCEQHGKRSAHGAADDAETLCHMFEFVKLGMIACPVLAAVSAPGFGERPQDVTVWIEDANFWHRSTRQIFLPPRLAQQVLGLEDRGCRELLSVQNRWWVCHVGVVFVDGSREDL